MHKGRRNGKGKLCYSVLDNVTCFVPFYSVFCGNNVFLYFIKSFWKLKLKLKMQ